MSPEKLPSRFLAGAKQEENTYVLAYFQSAKWVLYQLTHCSLNHSPDLNFGFSDQLLSNFEGHGENGGLGLRVVLLVDDQIPLQADLPDFRGLKNRDL